MSFDDYVRHVKLKYSLAIAIAVLKSKPETVTIEEYISSLRNKLVTSDQMENEFEISLGSDDFDMNDEFTTQGNEASATKVESVSQEINLSPNLLKDFDSENMVQRNSECDWQSVYSIVEALRLLDEKKTDSPANVAAEEVNQDILTLSNSIGLSSQNMILDTQQLYLQDDSQMKETKDLKKNITKFANRMEIVGSSQASQAFNINNGIENKTKSIETNEGREVYLSQTKNLMHIQEIDSQETQLYSLSEYTQNSHISQSDIEDNRFVILDKYVKKHCKPSNKSALEIISEMPRTIGSIQDHPNENNGFQDTQREYQNTGLFVEQPNQSRANLIVDTENKLRVGHHTVEMEETFTDTRYKNKEDNAKEVQIKSHEINTEMPGTSRGLEATYLDDSEEEIFDSQPETSIPFKIVEELDKVKATLNRRNERKSRTDSYSTDSGYRSDSQMKSFRSGKSNLGFHASSSWLNQSAHSLVHYLINCPLRTNSLEIIKEISQVLGELVDVLHTEEKYPSFLDAILEGTDCLLGHLTSGESSGETVRTQKDEYFHRIVLLNTSVHVIGSTIEKIITKLEHLHEMVTKDEDIHDMEDLWSIENSTFIFHVLENLLQRYVKKKILLSRQSNSQASDDQRMPMRSSITDFWKNKWDPEFKRKDATAAVTVEEKCLDIRIEEILKKLVIDCMPEYSLISFAALQCLNVLQ